MHTSRYITGALCVLLVAALGSCYFTGCASGPLTNVTKASADLAKWNQSTEGKLVLDKVKTASAAFTPQYAGVIGLGIDSLESGGTGTVPDPAAMQQTLASVTGSSADSAKILALAEAVDAVAHSAPTPNAGLNAAAATINAQAAPKLVAAAHRKVYALAQPNRKSLVENRAERSETDDHREPEGDARKSGSKSPAFRIGASLTDLPPDETARLLYPQRLIDPPVHFVPGLLNLSFAPGKEPVITFAATK